MKIFTQIGIVFGICIAGELIAKILPIPFPSAVIAMILIFILLKSKILKIEYIEDKANFLLGNMALFFIPSGVSIMNNFMHIKDYMWQIFLICIVTTILTFGVTALTVVFVIRLQNKFNKGGSKVE